MAITVHHVECIHLYGNQQADVLNCTHLLEDVTTWLHKMMVYQRHCTTKTHHNDPNLSREDTLTASGPALADGCHYALTCAGTYLGADTTLRIQVHSLQEGLLLPLSHNFPTGDHTIKRTWKWQMSPWWFRFSALCGIRIKQDLNITRFSYPTLPNMMKNT